MAGALAAGLAWALIAAAGGLAWWLFRLKVRPPRRAVPSLILWRRVVAARREASWWDRVRRAVSLAITVIVAIALALALAQLAPRATGDRRGRILIVLDASWSMRARTPEGGTRWQQAVAAARALARSTDGEVAIATTAEGLVEGPTADSALLSTAFDRLEPAGGDGFAWPKLDGVSATHFFTDGALLRRLEPGTIVHSVFRPAPNVAITAFGVRAATSTEAAPSAYLEVANYAPVPQRTHLTLARGATIVLDEWLELAAADVSRRIVPLELTGGATLRAHVSAAENALDVDDEAVAWLPAGDPIAVTVVSDAPDPFVELFANDPSIQATFLRTAEYRAGNADALVFDRWAPEQPPDRPALYLAPPARPWLARTQADEAAPRWSMSESHPVLNGVDPLPLDIVRARRYEGDDLKTVASSSRGTPLVSVLDAARRGVVVAFGLQDSNLASVTAFPVLVGNALDWLARPAAGEARMPGPIELPASTTRVVSPDGAPLPLVHAGNRVMTRLRSPGLYLVQAGGAESVIGVNVGSPAIANLMRTTLTDAESPSSAQQLSGRPWWMYAVALAFALAALEWWTWQRRVTV